MRKKDLKEIEYLVFEKFGNNITVLEYTKMSAKGKFRCNLHGVDFYTMPRDIIGRGTGCPQCANEGRRKKHSFSFDYVKNYINSTDCELISENYYGVDEKLLISFPCGHTKELSFYNFKKGSRCPECGRKLGGKSRRLGEKEIENRLKTKGLEIVEFVDGYLNNHSVVKTKCPKGHIETHDISSLLYSCRCNQCTTERVSLEKRGEGGNNWQGGKTLIFSYLQKKMKKWRDESLEISNHKCLICGETKHLHIHHLYNFYNIVHDAFRELGIKRRLRISEYDTKEIDIIVDKVLEIHYRHLLGVAICKKHHDEFHSWYGQYNNSLNQFEDFMQYKEQQKIASGELIIP